MFSTKIDKKYFNFLMTFCSYVHRFLRRLEKSIKNRAHFMSVTSDSDPVNQDGSGSDALLDSPKTSSPLLRKTSIGVDKRLATSVKKSSHILSRQMANYENSFDL